MDRRFSIGRVLAGAGSALMRRGLALLLVVATLQVGFPLLVSAAFGTPFVRGASELVAGLAEQLALLAADAMATGLLIHLTLTARSPLREALAVKPGAALKTALSVYAITLIARSATLLSFVPLYELRRRIMSGETQLAEISGVMGLITFAASTIGLILSIMLVAAKPAAVDEGLGPLAAIRRNFALTRGRRWLTTALVIASGLVVGGTQLAILLGREGLVASIGSLEGLAYRYGATPVVALSAVFLTCVYIELRRLADPGAQETARVFE